MKKKLGMRNNQILPAIFFICIGAMLLCGCSFALLNQINFNKTAIDGVAVITEIKEYRDSDGDISKSAYIEFAVDGEKYGGRLDMYTAGMKEGQNVDIKYSKEDPSKYSSSGSMMGLIAATLFCFIPVIIGIFWITKTVKKNALAKKLKETVAPIMAKIISAKVDNSIIINGNSTYRLICEYTNPADNKTYTFEEKEIIVDIDQVIRENEIKEIPVYVDLNNPSEYIIDIESLNKYFGY